jgi:ubiquinone/menaquinone biosynthesis C-methylase UbiE
MTDISKDANDKRRVHDFWNEASCGEKLYLSAVDRAGYEGQAEERYRLEPYIVDFAGFSEMRGRHVLEIGVGLGADHQRYAEAGAVLYGIDLTERAVEHTRRRLTSFGLSSELMVGDAEALPFPDESFDLVYSWGVLHHTPNTPKAVTEVHRVLKRGGGGTYHDLSQVEHGGFDALVALCVTVGSAMALITKYLCRTSGKSGN